MSAFYVAHTAGAHAGGDASFNSPSVDVGDFGIVVAAADHGNKLVDDATWDGVAMTLIRNDRWAQASAASTAIFYIKEPALGASVVTGDWGETGIASVGVAIVAKGILLPDPVGNSYGAGLNGAGEAVSELTSVELDALTFCIIGLETPASINGDQTLLYDGAVGAMDFKVGYTQYGTGIPTVNTSWDWGGNYEGAHSAAVFQGGGGRRGMVGVF